MGMYTQLHFASDLKPDTPKEVIEVLEAMATGRTDNLGKLPDHEFFNCSRWEVLFTMGSGYFDYDTHCKFWKEGYLDFYVLNVTSNLKNYDSEIEKFLDWINPYLDKYDDDFLGYHRYEETEKPTLIFYKAK
mgnify:CR=1 FL=1